MSSWFFTGWMVVCANTWEFFNPNELEYRGDGVVVHNYGVHDVCLHMKVIFNISKTLTNFTVLEFDGLCESIVLVSASHAQFTCEVHQVSGHCVKLSPQQRLLNFFSTWNMTTSLATMPFSGYFFHSFLYQPCTSRWDGMTWCNRMCSFEYLEPFFPILSLAPLSRYENPGIISIQSGLMAAR